MPAFDADITTGRSSVDDADDAGDEMDERWDEITDRFMAEAARHRVAMLGVR